MPKELCVCDNITDSGQQEIHIFNDRRKWGKPVTLVEFRGKVTANLEKFLKQAKRKLGSGGTIRGNAVELRGDFRFKLKKLLIDEGFDEASIFIDER